MLVKNTTPFFHGMKVTSRHPPQPEVALIVRGTFRIVPNGVVEALTDLEQGLLTGETFADNDAERLGQCTYPGDLADFKLNAEVLLKGACHGSLGKMVTSSPVHFAVGDWDKDLIVRGPRKFTVGGDVTDPAPFESIPLDYAHAFGGPSHAHNPVGLGFNSDVLPNVELPSHQLTRRGQDCVPGSFDAISSNWPARKSKLGRNYGAAYLKARAPFYADDFDWTHFQSAPADQQLSGYLRGDELVRMHNVHPEYSTLTTTLPSRRIRAFLKDESGTVREIKMVLDTLFAEPGELTIKLTWRGLTTVGEVDLRDVKTIYIAEEALAETPMPAAHYVDRLEAYEKDPTGVLAALPPGMAELWERREKKRRGESLAETPKAAGDDPLTHEIKRQFGGLLQADQLGELAVAMKQIDALPAEGKPELEKLAGEARAANDAAIPPMKHRKPGRLPDPELRPKMRAVVEEAARLREQEKQLGRPIEGIDKLEAVPRDPAWKKIDPSYEPPQALSTEPVGPGADLRERDLSNLDLRGVNLSGANLERANLANTDLTGANLSNTKLARSILFRVKLEGANLRGADLTLANAANVHAKNADFTEAYLTETFFEQADLSGATLDHVRAEYAIFESARLVGARAKGANFTQADFSRANLADAEFVRVTADHALFAEAVGDRANFEDAELSQASFAESRFSSGRFVGIKAVKAFFMKATLDDADFGYADVREAHFTEVHAKGSRFYGANLRGARLYRADLSRAQFVRANLMSVDARKAILDRANLSQASLYEAVLTGIAGGGLDLTDAWLERVVRDPS